jgi:hypothetical protein
MRNCYEIKFFHGLRTEQIAQISHKVAGGFYVSVPDAAWN